MAQTGINGGEAYCVLMRSRALNSAVIRAAASPRAAKRSNQWSGAAADRLLIDEPYPALPAHLATSPARPSGQAARDMAENLDSAMRAHHALISPQGNLHPVILSGYLSDPGLPLAAINEQSAEFGAPVVKLPREDVELDPVADAVDLYASDIVLPEYNLYGSLLAVDLGVVAAPRYGHVYVMMRPDREGIIRKLSLPIKDTLERKLRVFAHVLSGDLDKIHELAESYVQVMRLLSHLDRVHQAARGQVPLW